MPSPTRQWIIVVDKAEPWDIGAQMGVHGNRRNTYCPERRLRGRLFKVLPCRANLYNKGMRELSGFS